MSTKLLKIGIAMLALGLIVFLISAFIIELEHEASRSSNLIITENVVFVNMLGIFIGIPLILIGTSITIVIFVRKLY
ncbi:MAG: hypothetical protein LVO36_03765 [Nitrosopumilus sp. (ex Thoosa mismalolli)]|nr:hypothetical protein [Nitrosopumilus sp. (ex Thoosa mismalolli)]